MQKWEYKTGAFSIIEKGSQDGYVEKYLNGLGAEGWELVTSFIQQPDAFCFFFKRPLPPETTATKIFNEVKNEVEGGHMEVKTTS